MTFVVGNERWRVAAFSNVSKAEGCGQISGAFPKKKKAPSSDVPTGGGGFFRMSSGNRQSQESQQISGHPTVVKQ